MRTVALAEGGAVAAVVLGDALRRQRVPQHVAARRVHHDLRTDKDEQFVRADPLAVRCPRLHW